jgi:hypothetical protein
MDEYGYPKYNKPLSLRTKELVEELLGVNANLLSWIRYYCEKTGIPIPDQDGLLYLVKRTNEILRELKEIDESIFGYTEKKRRDLTELKDDKDLTESCPEVLNTSTLKYGIGR